MLHRNPVTNTEFNRRLADALRKYAIFPVPGFILKLVLGERAQLLLDNQPLIPQKLRQEGFKFKYETLDFVQVLK